MTREEAMTRAIKEAEAFCNGFEVAPYGKTFSDFREITTIQFFNKIYNDFEKELEELNNKSCKSCKHYKKTIHQDYKTCFLIKNNGYNLDCGDDFYCNRYEAKS